MTKKQKKVLWRIIISAALVVVLQFLPIDGYLGLALYLVPYLVIGHDILKKAIKGIRNREVFDENFLMAVATVGALVLGEYVEGTAVMLFYQVGELFQSYAVGKSRRNIAALMDIRPDYANLLHEDGTEEEVDPEEVPVGSVILVKPGERVPIDGVVLEGNSELNTASLTGESLPREVSEGDEIISGCVNLTGVLKLRTTKEFGESTVSKILDLVENSSMKKSRSENFIARFAHFYTPIVCYSAVALAIIPPIALMLMGNAPMWGEWITRALTFLVISCPCALVISIPLSFFGGIGGASANGILIKGSNYLEALSYADTVVFDKTGTLTQGAFAVTEIILSENAQVSEEELLCYAAHAESFSTHPISKGIADSLKGAVDKAQVSDVTEIAGHGITAKCFGKEVAVGNRRLMERMGIALAQSEDSAETGGTSVYVAIDNCFVGCMILEDMVKKEAISAIEALKTAGVRKTVMLTGDIKQVARKVAKTLGIDEVHSELLPADKVSKVEDLLAKKRKGKTLAFVGDGINDAPVLSRADIGIAMGALGSDAAIEAADVVLMDDNPEKIALAMKISRKCMRIVYQNIVFAIGIKVLCLVLGAVGIANMWIAIFADVGVMVIAVLNAIRALYVKK